jgi:hypothetical protein
MARLLRPFRDHVVERAAAIRLELEEHSGDLVEPEQACPGCGERHIDRLAINEDDSVVCSNCGRRYHLPDEDRTDIVICECSPAVNPTCAIGPHGERHRDEAAWKVSEANDRDEFFYLCTPCKESRETAPDAAGFRFVMIGEEEADTDA